MAPDTWQSLLAEARRELAEGEEIRWLLEQVAERPLPELIADLARPVSPESAVRFRRLLERRRSGEPLQHVLGRWGFRNLDLLVDGRALVPRAETELVVGKARAELASMRPANAASGGSARVVDLGTGSGAIACSLVDEEPEIEVIGTDCSSAALQLAEENRERLRPDAASRLRFAAGDWYGALPTTWRASIDVIVSNPPYLAEAELDDLDPVVANYDPYEALVAGPTGLEALATVIGGAAEWLRPGAVLVVEIGASQGPAALGLAKSSRARDASVAPDLAGRDRILVARW